jgi:hypothetical protein
MSDVLSATDCCFVNLVASRKYGAGDPAPPAGLDDALAAVSGKSPHERAASLAVSLLGRHVFETASAETALLVMLCQLNRDGFELVAPQGAVVGMLQGARSGSVDGGALTRWLEDRSVALSPR